MPIKFKQAGSQWPTSQKIRENYANQNQTLILSFSRGKDSLAAWLAMLDSGIKPENIHPIYYYRCPDLKFSEESLKKFEDYFQQHITRYPHPALLAQLYGFGFQPITRIPVIAAAGFEPYQYQDLEEIYRNEHGLDDNTYACNGARAADGISRRTYMKKTGPITHSKQKVAIIWDWTIQECYDRINQAGINLEEYSPDYKWFKKTTKTGKPIKHSGRTFDGIAAQFLEPLEKYAPDDYQRFLEWFPLAKYENMRHHLPKPENN